MNKFFSLALLVAGVVLIAYGIKSSDSILSDISRLYGGLPTDKSLWLLLVGFVAAILGAAGVLHNSKSA